MQNLMTVRVNIPNFIILFIIFYLNELTLNVLHTETPQRDT